MIGQGIAFHYDGGIRLTRSGLALDFRRRQPKAFISHAHADHLARHEYALCTEATAALYHHRMGRRLTRMLNYGETVDWAGMRLTTFPAGHCLGSAMLLVEENGHRLLYTGDFKLRPSLTVPAAVVPEADILITECTFGSPEYRFPPRQQVAAALVAEVHTAWEEGRTPVVVAYSLGKAQEVTRILTGHGLRVRQHASVFEISEIYRRFGVELGDYAPFEGTLAKDEVLVFPPQARGAGLPDRAKRIAATGWAVHPAAPYRMRAEAAVPLSDHADFDELFELVERVRPRIVYCTHGPAAFVDRLLAAGYEARLIDGPTQRRLF